MDHEYSMLIFTVISVLAGYLLGAIPSGLLLCKISGYGDIRKIGSHNIGATNVLRTGNKLLALITLLLDTSKGAIIVIILSFYLMGNYVPKYQLTDFDFIHKLPDYLPLIAGLGAILGHCFPVWLKFKGGKGVATTVGVLLAAVPYAGLAACAAWLLSAFAFRISSLAALIAMAVAPLVTFFVYGVGPAWIVLLITVLVYLRHKDNIRRLLKGEEPKIGSSKTFSPPRGKDRGEGD